MNAPATPDTGDTGEAGASTENQPAVTPSDPGFQPQPPVLADVVEAMAGMAALPEAGPAAAETVAAASEPAPAPAPASTPAASASSPEKAPEKAPAPAAGTAPPIAPSVIPALNDLAAAVLDSAELANRGAQAAANVSTELHRATEVLQATQSSVRRQSYVVMGIVTLVTFLALMFIVVTGIRMNSRINQLDATLLAVAQRAVALNEGLGSLETINESVGKLAGQVEVLARATGEVGTRLDQTAKQSETLASQIPVKTAEQVAAGNQNLARQFEGLNTRLQAQSAAVQALGREVQALKGATANVEKLNRDVQALVTLQRERYLEAMQRNAAAAAGNANAERERERALQYPRVQPPVSPNATPGTTTNSSGAIVVAPPRAN